MPPDGSGTSNGPDPLAFSGFQTLKENYTAIIIGASGGIGRACVQAIADDPRCSKVYALSRSPTTFKHSKIITGILDLQDEDSITTAFDKIASTTPDNLTFDLVFVATGFLHDDVIAPEKSWKQLTALSFEKAFAINTIGPALIAKHALPRMSKSSKTIFAALSARVSSIDDNRLGGWHAYRASKAALNMLIKNFAIEAKRKLPEAVIVGLHPGTVDTALSQPFQANVPNKQLFTPEISAAHLLNVADNLHADDSGNLFAWDGKRIQS